MGGSAERTNLAIVETICGQLDNIHPSTDGHYRQLIRFVADRPGHDRRYAIDHGKLTSELGWRPSESCESGLAKTVHWYLDNRWWWEPILAGTYGGQRLGLAAGAARAG